MVNEEKLEQQMIDDINENCLDEIVEDTIKQIDEMPFGITEDEVESQEVIEELNVKVGDDDASTNK